MSFKRDGDDAAMLRNLQNRRVGDLLANNIPDDEASLLSNGRLTCTVCSYRPVFDTLAMLAVHRKGKKHICELSKHLAQKREHERRKLKRDQLMSLRLGEAKVKKEEVSPLPTLGKPIIAGPAYSSCVKRPNKQKFQGFNRKAALDLDCRIDKESYSGQKEEGLLSTSSEVRRYLKSLWKKKGMQKTIERCREGYGLGKDKPSTSGMHRDETTTSSQSTPTTSSSEVSKQAQHELKLRMSGWIKDLDGHWVKDPEAEFDSDEEEPAGPPD